MDAWHGEVVAQWDALTGGFVGLALCEKALLDSSGHLFERMKWEYGTENLKVGTWEWFEIINFDRIARSIQ